jgi:NTP pyrophosphatase (non-canonical NTP hydrolase)
VTFPTINKYQPDYTTVRAAGRSLQFMCHIASLKAGWWHDINTGDPLDPKSKVPEKLMLTVSELAEAMEAHRKDLMDDKIVHRKGLEVELADALIRIFDLGGALGFDLGAAISEKMEFNANRPDHKIENRLAAGGKAY